MSQPLTPPPGRRVNLNPVREPQVEEILGPAVAPLSFGKVLQAIRRHLLLVLAITAVIGGAFAYREYTKEPVYRATAVLRLKDTRREITGNLAEPVADGDAQSHADPVLSQIQLLLSRNVAGAVVDGEAAVQLRVQPEGIAMQALRGVRIDSGATADSIVIAFTPRGLVAQGQKRQVRAGYGAPVEVDGVRFIVARAPDAERAVLRIAPRERAIDALLGGLQARPRERTDVIDVEYTANDAELATRIVNAVVQTFSETSTQRAQEQSRRRRIFIEEQLAKNDSVMASAQRALGEFRSREQAYSSREKFVASQEGLASLMGRREELDADRRTYQMLLEMLQRGGGSDRLVALVSAPELSQNPALTGLYGQLVRFQTTRDSLTTGAWASAETHPDVQRLDTLIASTSTKLVSMVRSYVDGLDARIAALDGLVAARNSAMLRRLPASEAEEGLLLQTSELTRRLTDQLREELQKARMAEAVEAGRVEIVDLASSASQVHGVGRTRMLAFGLLLGLLFGGGSALVAEHNNTSIRRRSEMESLLLIPSLAVIPQIPGSRPATTNRLRLPRLGDRAAATNGADGHALDSGLVMLNNLRSSSAEAYRTLRTNLLFSQMTRELKKIVITSAAPGDGKTTVSANLAITFAQQGIRVLLIDCDLRRARQHHVFSVKRVPGFSELIIGRNSVDETVKPTHVDGLSLLPAGTLPPNPAELLGGQRVQTILDALVQDYDVLILDTPPVLAAADSAVLAGAADGVLLVVRAGQTEREAARDALRQLNTVGAHILGAVLNDPDANVPQYSGRYYEYWSGPTAAAR